MNEIADAERPENTETILIRGKEVPVVATTYPQTELRFFVDNPRVYSVLRRGRDSTAEPSQEEIQALLLDMEHVKDLIQAIKINGGLTDPIIVRDGTLDVLEGNSRLAAYRHLAQGDPIRWGRIKVRLLPDYVDEKLIMALLGQYHVIGKTAWSPFEKAGFLYRRHKNHEVSLEDLAVEVGERERNVTHMVKVYAFMIEHGQEDQARWSYYDEYLKSRYIKRARDKDFDKLIVDKIDSEEIQRAVDIRDKLKVICKVPRILEKFKNGEYEFEVACDLAAEVGADRVPYDKLTKFLKWLATPETEQSLGRADGEVREKIKYELKQLLKIVESRLKMLSR